jgi:hypothetical protein
MIDQGKFKDVALNTNAELDGEVGTIGAFVLQAGASSTTATTTTTAADSTGPLFWATEPGDGEEMVAPTTTVQAVQRGGAGRHRQHQCRCHNGSSQQLLLHVEHHDLQTGSLSELGYIVRSKLCR